MRVSSATFAMLLCVTGPVVAQPPPIVNLRLPSDAAGGGTLAVRLTIPPQAIGPRFADGAPVLVFVPGAQGVGGLAGGESYALEGFVAVTFIFPGGTAGGNHSDGTYDYRGARCIDALRDVLLFAGGRKTDNLGRTIEELLPIPALTEMCGMIGSSNGGPISMAALGTHGAELDFVATYVGWENPTNGQTVVVEAGGKFYDCDPNSDGDGNGIPNDDGKNPYLTGYSAVSLPMDWDRLAYDPAYTWTVTDPANQHPPVVHSGGLLLDGNGNGRVDSVPADPDCYDLNENGTMDIGEDYLFRPTLSYESGALVLYHSLETTNEAEARNLFGASWPSDIANPGEAASFWALRDATNFYNALTSARPDLHCMLVFAAADHVQAADEHPHIQQAYDGLGGGGIWCRLNPDEAYYRLVDPTPPAPPADNDANIPVSWPDMPGHDEDYPLSSNLASMAAVMEMADRAHAAVWIANLAGPVTGLEGSGTGRTVRLSITPNPATPDSHVEWTGLGPGPFTIRLCDLSGRVLSHRSMADRTAEGKVPLSEILPGRRSLAAGIYWIRVESSGWNLARPVVLLHP